MMVSTCKFVLGYILIISTVVFSQNLLETPEESIRLSRSPRFHKHHGNIFGLLGGGYHESPQFKPYGGFGGGAAQSQAQASAGGAQAQAQSQSLFFGLGPFTAGLAQSQAQAQARRRNEFDYYDY